MYHLIKNQTSEKSALPFYCELENPEIVVTTEFHAMRLVAEQFIKQIFSKAYQADIHTFYPDILMLNRDNGICGTVGIRSADDYALMVESYLQRSIETCLFEQKGLAVSRHNIVEVGNLAMAHEGMARWLIFLLTNFLHGAEFKWVVFTAVPKLVNAFRKMHLEPVFLANAKQELIVQNSTDNWGSYYDVKPAVYYGDISRAFAFFAAMVQSNMSLKVIADRAWEAGKLFKDRVGTIPAVVN